VGLTEYLRRMLTPHNWAHQPSSTRTSHPHSWSPHSARIAECAHEACRALTRFPAERLGERGADLYCPALLPWEALSLDMPPSLRQSFGRAQRALETFRGSVVALSETEVSSDAHRDFLQDRFSLARSSTELALQGLADIAELASVARIA
jgi:hypothetical protein